MEEYTFKGLADELRDFTERVVNQAHLQPPDLRKVLSFIAKVTQVVEQAGQDVFTVLIDIKYLSPDDLNSSRLEDLRRQVDLLTLRSRYRDVEEICSRLHHLSDQFHQQIAPLVSGVADTSSWQGMFGLLDDREGRVIMLVHFTTQKLQAGLDNVNSLSMPELKRYAGEQVRAFRDALDELRELRNRILGLSGNDGLLELLEANAETAAGTSLSVNLGGISMSRDTYNVTNAGAVGPGAVAKDVTFNQVWNQSASQIDLKQLAVELATLRTALVKEASGPDHYVAVGEVAAAEKAAQSGDGPTVMEHLKKAGAWVWDVATKIGIEVATSAAKKALGI